MVPGAIAAEDVPVALAHLRQALAATPPTSLVSRDDDNDDATEQHVNLQQRAVPLLEMLGHAVAAKSYVMWEK